jgi:hypothetical protein
VEVGRPAGIAYHVTTSPFLTGIRPWVDDWRRRLEEAVLVPVLVPALVRDRVRSPVSGSGTMGLRLTAPDCAHHQRRPSRGLPAGPDQCRHGWCCRGARLNKFHPARGQPERAIAHRLTPTATITSTRRRPADSHPKLNLHEVLV